MRLGITIAICAPVIVSVIGCSNSGEPQTPLAGMYVLQSINGAALPATAAQGGGQQYILVADSLAFGSDFQVQRTYTVRWLSNAAPYDTTYTRTATFPYTRSGDRVTIGAQLSCGPGANCTGSETGSLDGASLRVTARIFWPGDPEFLFARR